LNIEAIQGFSEVGEPQSFDYTSTNTDTVIWKRQRLIFNILKEEEKQYLERIKEKYSPDQIGHALTGEIEPGEEMNMNASYYLKAKPYDWIAIVFHARMDGSEKAGDNFWRVEKRTLGGGTSEHQL